MLAIQNPFCRSMPLTSSRLCSSTIEHHCYLTPLLACRLIALDKCPGVRPIGICETQKRIIAKAILSITRGDILEAVGTDQLYAGQTAEVEAAIHSIRDHYRNPEVEAVLLVDATNAFNSLNREDALHNAKHLCPTIATALSNFYCCSTELFCDKNILWSQEGTTQGDPLAMPFYALSTLPLIRRLPGSKTMHHVWYADDASATGSLNDIKQWYSAIIEEGPSFGYFANPAKSWIVVKE